VVGTTTFEAARTALPVPPQMRSDAADIAVLPGGRLVGVSGFVVTDDGLLATETAWDDRKLDEAGVLQMRRLPRADAVPGVHASLISQWCDAYYHWITDALPRLKVLEAAGYGDVNLAVPVRLAPWQQRSLELLGIPSTNLTPYSGRHLRAETLVWPRPVALPGNTPLWACEWLRERFVPPDPQSHRRLYMTRRQEKVRRVSNETALWTLLEARGFEMVDPGTLTFDQQIALFADTSIVAAPHGGALANILFAQHATIIELFEPSYVNLCFYVIADRCGHNYRYIVGEPDPRQNITIGPAQLAAVLDAVGA
jgi:capsular polysaccharide biosynthesis protein